MRQKIETFGHQALLLPGQETNHGNSLTGFKHYILSNAYIPSLLSTFFITVYCFMFSDALYLSYAYATMNIVSSISMCTMPANGQ